MASRRPLRLETLTGMVVIVSSAIGALGTILSAAIAVLGIQLKRAVDGQVSELQARVAVLESVLAFARDRPIEDSLE